MSLALPTTSEGVPNQHNKVPVGRNTKFPRSWNAFFRYNCIDLAMRPSSRSRSVQQVQIEFNTDLRGRKLPYLSWSNQNLRPFCRVRSATLAIALECEKSAVEEASFGLKNQFIWHSLFKGQMDAGGIATKVIFFFSSSFSFSSTEERCSVSKLTSSS